MTVEQILKDAKATPVKGCLEPHSEAINTLREKGYTWREISGFLNDRGIQADHTRIYRFYNKIKLREQNIMKKGMYITEDSYVNLEQIFNWDMSDDRIILRSANQGDSICIKNNKSSSPVPCVDYEVGVNEFKRIKRSIIEYMGLADA